PSFSCPLVGCNLSPQFALSFLVANGFLWDCQGVFVVGEGIIGQDRQDGGAGGGVSSVGW
nr:hypothetical protein [Tanacetum cinerariifolium]